MLKRLLLVFKRIFQIITLVFLLIYVLVEVAYYSLRWIYNGKLFPDYPFIVRYINDYM